MVRRLPVLQSRDDDERPRPDWQWILIGAGFVVTLFLPLSMVGTWLGAKLVSASSAHPIVLGALPVAFSFVLASGASGALVARFGGRPEQALNSSLVGSLLVWGIAAALGALSTVPVALAALVALLLLGLLSAWLGARLVGRRPG
jgi:hypothetical protein